MNTTVSSGAEINTERESLLTTKTLESADKASVPAESVRLKNLPTGLIIGLTPVWGRERPRKYSVSVRGRERLTRRFSGIRRTANGGSL